MTDAQLPEPSDDDRANWSLIWQVWISLLVVAALVVGVIALTNDDTGSGEAAPAAGGPGAGAAGAGTASEANADLGEFFIEVDSPVPPGTVTFHASNSGAVAHNFALKSDPAQTTGDIQPGQMGMLTIDLTPGSYEFFCSIAGHEAAGMLATVTVEEGAAASGQAAGGGETGASMDYGAMQQAMLDSFAAFPAETEGGGNEVLEPTILADGAKQFELTAAVTEFEVEPGKVVDAWSYNGQVPGPVIKVDVGDEVEILVHNDLPIGTDVHFHGIRTPFEDDGVAPITQDLIESGADHTYRFTVNEPAVGMYHAHFAGQVAVPNGLLGTFLVGQMPLPTSLPDGAGDLSDEPAPTSVAQELPMVLNDAGAIGLSINGKSFPATEPIVANTGDWLMFHYENEGLQVHPMHLHQFPQLIIAKDGLALEQPYWADTVLVGPGERYTVLVRADVPGTWVWHCHILNHVEREQGMFGMVTALVVQ
jgi:FtsP/CotA-like multicopper oxidase with cupredoxin domain